MGYCAILLGVPIEKQEYLDRIDASDYLKRYKGEPENNWATVYEPLVALPLRRLAHQAAQMGWDVRRRATLKDLQAVATADNVVVLLSHWKGYGFSNDDFVQPVENSTFAAIAAQTPTPLATWLQRAFERQQSRQNTKQSSPWNTWLEALGLLQNADKTLRDILEEALDATIANDQSPQTLSGIAEYVESQLARRTRRRQSIDQLFAGLIAPGNRLELFDGLYDCETIAQSIDQTFVGLMDLTTCTSTILADRISLHHQYRFRVIQFDKNQEPVWAAATLGAVLGLMAKGYGYLDARQQAIQLVREVVMSKIGQHKGGIS